MERTREGLSSEEGLFYASTEPPTEDVGSGCDGCSEEEGS